MGRRGISIHEPERWVFNRLAEDYRARPAYPEALIERLSELAGGPGGRIVDVGAGTGHLALPLAARGLRVSAVEPAQAMLAELVARGGGVRAQHAAAEETGLASGGYDLAVVADALHWIDPALAGREIARLLRPGGACAVVEIRLADTPFLRALTHLMARLNPKAHGHQGRSAAQFLALATPKATPALETFHQETPLTAGGLAAVLRSLSYAGPALGATALSALVDQAQALAAAHGGATWSRTLTVTWARAPA